MNSANVYADALGKTVLRDAQRLKKFFVEYLPWMNGRELGLTWIAQIGHCRRLTSSVVVYQLHLVSIALSPDKTEAPLIVDSDTVLTPSVTRERFQPISRRNPEVVEVEGVVQDHEFLLRPSLDTQR